MKNNIRILALLFALTAPLCAALSVDGNLNVIIDGSNHGRAEDFIKNNPTRAGEVFLAIRAHHATVTAAAAAAETAKAAETARVATIVAALKGVAPEALPDAARAALLTAKEKEVAALAAQKAAIEKQLASLTK